MEHYITLFDSAFLPQGLALFESIRRHSPDSVLWVLCMDSDVHKQLLSLRQPGLVCIAVTEVEAQFPELLRVKVERSRAEYCWTLTPFTPKLVFDREPLAIRATYIDADTFLLRNPAELFSEFERSGKAVQITEHAYDPDYDQSDVSGRFCVQFMTFTRDRGEVVRRWWQDQCIAWCFARPEPGRFGDQKYLDDWPIRFKDHVHVASRLGAFMAPWNARRFACNEAYLWHFQGLRILSDEHVLLHDGYDVPADVHARIYAPYLRVIAQKLSLCKQPITQGIHRPTWVRALKVLARIGRQGWVAFRRRPRVASLKVLA